MPDDETSSMSLQFVEEAIISVTIIMMAVHSLLTSSVGDWRHSLAPCPRGINFPALKCE